MKIKYKKIVNFLNIQSIKVESELDPDSEIFGINSLKEASQNHITFFNNTKYVNDLKITKAKACLIKNEFVEDLSNNCIPIIVEDPYKVFALLSQLFNTENDKKNINMADIKYNHIGNHSKIDKSVFIDNFSSISNNVEILKGVKIGCNVSIGSDVFIGENTIIKDNISLSNCLIEENCVIKSGARIGGTGFGFDPNSKEKIIHTGNVIIKKFSHIGSNTTIDRAVFDSTIIGEYSHIDNLVQIAHNVKVGSKAIIAAQVGIAGSTIIGDNIKIGGQAGISGHLKIGNNVTIAAKSGVTKNISDNKVVAGFPAKDILKWKKEIIKLNKL
ncbi:UDP-3-O-(3-hydroxymyristoyl)glucosamine N-acyltransferase [Pelagibacteraceae bacterium]|nr:UDP-3-O-(3-hydroxymyristoyl)glucosamine N-acyltransferase [Pelagibacteraceae bacterium]